MSQTAPDHNELIERIGRDLYSSSCAATWIPSDEADIFRLTLDHEMTSRILKIERDDRWVVRREQQAFPVLRARGLTEFPEVEFTQADLGVDGPAFIVMPETAWRPWEEIWSEGEELAAWIVGHAGNFLRRLRTIDWRSVPGCVSPKIKSSSYEHWYLNWLAPLRDLPSMHGALEDALNTIFEMIAQEPEGFGGWQGGQVLTDGRSTFTVIDWSNIGAHWPLEDVAGTISSLSNFGENAPDKLVPVLLEAVGELTSDEVRELRHWETLWRLSHAAGFLRDKQNDRMEEELDAARLFIAKEAYP